MRPLAVIAAVVFLQLLVTGANFSTLHFYGSVLGANEALIGLLWFVLSGPRALLTPFWGSVSDRWGRKPVLVIGTLGTIAGSLLWAKGGNYWVLFASRLVDSLLSAQAGIAMAIVADTTPREKRAAWMGVMGSVVMLAFVIGPPVGAIVAEKSGFRVLGLGMAGLQALSLLLILVALPETRPVALAGTGRLHVPLLEADVWRRLLASPSALVILAVLCLLTGGYSHFNTAFPKAAEVWQGFGQRECGYAFALLGLLGAVVQGGLIRPLAPRVGERVLSVSGTAIMGVSFLLMAQGARGAGFLWWGAALLGIGGGFAIPVLNALLSRVVHDDDQGLVMGLAATATGLGRAIGPALAGALLHVGTELPFYSAVGLLGVAAMLATRAKAPPHGGPSAQTPA
ncbi:MFS transporter [Candidatus Poribacteria bacterium]|nr:MFS transporter [Candidatus Poribacteria bacterium]